MVIVTIVVWCVQGFEFGGQCYVDTRLQFGLRLAPELAHRFPIKRSHRPSSAAIGELAVTLTYYWTS
jgi:hypothetical protein